MAMSKVLPAMALLLLIGTCFAGRCDDNMFGKQCIRRNLVATYDDILRLLQQKILDPEVLLIDVRRPGDLKLTGIMPHSINMPLEVVHEDLQLSPEAFEMRYDRKKPSMDTPIIFSSRTGERAGDAANIAHKLGFKNVRSYVGSWDEFARIRGLRQE